MFIPSIETKVPGATPATLTGMVMGITETKAGHEALSPFDSGIGGKANWTGAAFVVTRGCDCSKWLAEGMMEMRVAAPKEAMSVPREAQVLRRANCQMGTTIKGAKERKLWRPCENFEGSCIWLLLVSWEVSQETAIMATRTSPTAKRA